MIEDKKKPLTFTKDKLKNLLKSLRYKNPTRTKEINEALEFIQRAIPCEEQNSLFK